MNTQSVNLHRRMKMFLNTLMMLIAVAIVGYILHSLKQLAKEERWFKQDLLLESTDGRIVSARNIREATLLTGITKSQIKDLIRFKRYNQSLEISACNKSTGTHYHIH